MDTGVFSDTLSPSREGVGKLYTHDLVGRNLLISVQTAAEIRYGARWRNWGKPRLDAMERHLASVTEVPPHAALTREWAVLRNECRRSGHAFHNKVHTGDLWIAATATLLNLPLVTHDGGFREVPGLSVICYV